jgi:hypothetical protein
MADVKSAVASARDGLENAREKIGSGFAVIREAAPSLTTGLLIVTFLVGVGAGAVADRFYTRWAVNREWRDRIAAAQKPTQDAIDQGNAASADVDAAGIEKVRKAFADASKAEKDLRVLQSKFSSTKSELDLLKSARDREAETANRDRCSVPADCLR